MKDQLLTPDDVRELLLEKIEKYETRKAFCEATGASTSHVCEILQGYKLPGGKAIDALGLECVTRYRRKSR